MKETKQHRALTSLTTIPTIMRLSIIAFFIALPAAAYACVPLGGDCNHFPCCNFMACAMLNPSHNGIKIMVCLTADLL